jgi:hypothetical protein
MGCKRKGAEVDFAVQHRIAKSLMPLDNERKHGLWQTDSQQGILKWMKIWKGSPSDIYGPDHYCEIS